MNWKTWTEKRWFWPAVCLLSLAAGWWYLSIITCAPLGGDDEIINLQNYYFVQHHTFGEVLAANWQAVLPQFLLQSGRFRPFSSPPLLGWTSYFLGDLVGYRLYILAWTYADILLTGWLVGKAARSKAAGALCFCLLPLMFSLWQDSTGNSLYSYGALVQSTLLPVLLAGLCILRWQDTGRKRWAVLGAYCAFHACATFEIGFVYIVPLFGLAWLYTGQVRPALRLSVPVLAGEGAALAFNLGARVVNSLRAAGVLAGEAADLGGISPSFDLPAILRTWLMQMSAGFPLNAMIFAKMRPGAIAWSDVACGVLLAAAVLAALAAFQRLPAPKENWLLFLTGLALLSAPALMIAVSPKYQQTSNVDWRHGYIPQTVESFGVGLMAAALLIALLRRVRGKRWWPRWRVAVSLVLAVGLAGSAVWQRAATRSAYAGGGRDYTVFSESVAAGIADPAGTEDPVVCDYMVWGGDLTAQKAFFQRYAGTDTNAHALQVWRGEAPHAETTVYRLGVARGADKAYDIAWFAAGADDQLETVTGVTVYLPPRAAQAAVLCYTTRAADGTETAHTAPAADLQSGTAADGGCWLQLPAGDPVVGDSIRLQAP